MKSSTGSVPNNLPLSLSSFIGRQHEIAELELLLPRTRLLTLTGAGGCGKTRLALHIATNSLDNFEDGVWWIELATLQDPTLLPQAILQVLGLPDLSDREPTSSLVDYFQSKTTLLILDNCEHIIDACARLVSDLLQTCPQLSIITTSREALNIDGELAWIVPSLQIPALQPPFKMADLNQYDAVQLFVARASAITSDFRLTEQNAATVMKICQKLDGIPLAIELAAVRIKALAVEQIAERLDDVMHLLTEGKRAAPQRHYTLQAAMDWSYKLLSTPEQTLFRRLSVFVSGWILEAAESICEGDKVEIQDVLNLLTHLVEKSLVIKQEQGEEARYRFLEPIRQFARDKLVEEDEEAAIYERHLSYFHDWAQATEPKLLTADQLKYLSKLERDLDNFRVALQWSLKFRPLMALRIVSALTFFWNIRGYSTEGRRWGEQALKQNEDDFTPEVLGARARTLSTVAYLTMTQGDNQTARDLNTQAIALLRAQQDDPGLARALSIQSSALFYLGQSSQARATAKEAIGIASEIDDRFSLAVSNGAMASDLFQAGEMTIAQHFVEEAIVSSRRLGVPQVLAAALWLASKAAIFGGDLNTARQFGEESLTLIRPTGDKHRIYWIASHLGWVLWRTGNYQEAEKLYIEAIHGWWDYGQLGGIARCIECLAFIAIARRKEKLAARWLAAAEALREGSHSLMIPAEQDEFQRELSQLRSHMKPSDFRDAWSEGRKLSLEQIVSEVEQESKTSQAKIHSPNALTPRELDVLHWLVQGLSDAQIAEKLVLSRRTVTTHLTTIYNKLGVNSRSAAIRHALDKKLI